MRRAGGALIAAMMLLPLAGCDQTAPVETVEEQRLPAARAAMPAVFASLGPNPLAGTTTRGRDTDEAAAAGKRLWDWHRNHQQSGGAVDDRPLYWSRLRARAAFIDTCAGGGCTAALAAFETASRGVHDVHFNRNAHVNILISGFDPFLLDDNINQSNPSGAAALALDDQLVDAGGVTAEIQALIAPVRYGDFDAGWIEATFGPLLAGGKVNLLVTISMGRAQFDLERFPGRRRSAISPGNRNLPSQASAQAPVVPRLGADPLPGPEFVEFSLPVEAMLAVQQPFAVNDNRTVTTLERGTFAAAGLHELADQTAVSGSGGGYLSNEISFRTVRLIQAQNLPIAAGHLHTPRVAGNNAVRVQQIIGQIRALLAAAARGLPPTQRPSSDPPRPHAG